MKKTIECWRYVSPKCVVSVVCQLQVYGVPKIVDVVLGVLIQGNSRTNWLFVAFDDL